MSRGHCASCWHLPKCSWPGWVPVVWGPSGLQADPLAQLPATEPPGALAPSRPRPVGAEGGLLFTFFPCYRVWPPCPWHGSHFWDPLSQSDPKERNRRGTPGPFSSPLPLFLSPPTLKPERKNPLSSCSFSPTPAKPWALVGGRFLSTGGGCERSPPRAATDTLRQEEKNVENLFPGQ